MPEPRKLRVFLCHASQDKLVVRDLYQRVVAEALKMLELDKHLPQVPIPNFGKKSREELITILHAKGYIEK